MVFPWKITKIKVVKPFVLNTDLVYNKKEQTPGIKESGVYNLTGDLSGKNAGEYIAAGVLADTVNYEWADGTTADVIMPCR